MLSILIPVFNQDIRKLVEELQASAQYISVPYEIVIFDDGSTDKSLEKLNSSLQGETHIRYVALNENIGRSRIRNQLAREATYDRLLFLDCDSRLKDAPTFLKNYMQLDDPIIYGGRIYRSEEPDAEFLLHWRYGHTYESKPASKRSSSPYRSFHSNNFLIDKEVMIRYAFDESHKGYGYEDVAYAHELKQVQLPIKHIDNEVIHYGLDTRENFLDKTDEAVQNLLQYKKKGVDLDVKLLRTYEVLQKSVPKKIMSKISDRYLQKIRRNLLSDDPSLRYYQWYKLIRLFDAATT